MPREFDVFLSYHWRDQREVDALARKLRGQGLAVFLDRWYLTPGQPWPQALERVLATCSAVAVCVGPGEMGPWQQREKYFALERQGKEPGFPVIPVLLTGADPALGFLGQNTWVDFRESLDQPMMLAILVAAIRGEAPGPELRERIQETLAAISPYKGLAYFREEDAVFFFGRNKAIDTLWDAVQRRNFVAVVGASGSGKSSVVRAGLVPRLRADTRDPWEIVTIVPGDRPLYNLAARFIPLLEPERSENDQLIEVGKQTRALQDGSLQVRDVVERILGKQPGTQRFLLIVDQWEELYTLAPAADARCFIDDIIGATDANVLSVVLTLRGDFVGRALGYRPLSDRLQDAQVNLGPMSREELKQAIEEPANKVGATLEPGLVERILDEVGDEPGHLPLLEFLLQRLWDDPERYGGAMRHAAYDAIGGLEGALANTADAAYGRLSDLEKQAARRIFLQLVRPGKGAEDTRRRATFEELGEEARAIVKRLADARLLVTGRDGGSAEETVEVAHEALIQHWSLYKAWLNEDREFLLWRERLRVWIEGRSLLRDAPLAEAKGWLAKRSEELKDDEREFIGKSLAAARRRKWALWGATALAIVFLSVLSIWQYRELETERERRRPILREEDWIPIKPGQFDMGSPDADMEATDFEKKQHPVHMSKAFKLSRYEVTFEEYDRFAYATGRRPPSDSGFSAGLSDEKRRRLPVINVSYEDAKAYADWLSQETSKHFRLPTEAEWEYAARAGTRTRRFWGDAPSQACEYANVFDKRNQKELSVRYAISWEPHDCEDSYAVIAPVGQFRPNRWGLYDMLGNVWEWVQDCWHENYEGAPEDGSKAWKEGGDCSYRVIRGGSWGDFPGRVRSASRTGYEPVLPLSNLGFRLAQDLD